MPALSIPKKLERPLTIKTLEPVIKMKHFLCLGTTYLN